MNNEVPFAKAAQQLRLLIGKSDLTELAKNVGISEQRLKDALAGKIGLDSQEIDKLTMSPQRAYALKDVTAQDRRHASNKPASS